MLPFSHRRVIAFSLLGLLVPALLAACSDVAEPAPAVPGGGSGGAGGGVSSGSGGGAGQPSARDPKVGTFTLETTGGTSLRVLGEGGRVLLAGNPPSDEVGQGYALTEENPPVAGFATREVVRTTQMLFGSFKHVEEPKGPWRIARTVADGADGKSIDVKDAAGMVLATLRPTQGDDDHHLVVEVTPGPGPERRFSWAFECAKTDHYQGFGAQTWGVDARGESIPVWVGEQGIGKDDTDDPKGSWFLRGRRHSSYLPLPEFLSSRGYFAVAETNGLSTFAMCSEQESTARLQLELPVRVHLFDGPTPREALVRKTAHFGRSRVPPDFAFAPWNDAIYGSAEVRRVAKVLRDAKIPSSVIWTEDWRGGEPSTTIKDGYTLKEEWDLDRELYPDFEALASELHAEGFKFMVYFNPFVAKASKAWPETQPLGYLIKKGNATYEFDDAKFDKASLVDFSNPAAHAWAVGKLKTSFTLGADGFMGDFSEWLPTDATCAGGSGEALHNTYPVAWQKAQREAMDTMGDGVERLTFVRTGWFGTPALADVFWAGDQSTDFKPDDGMPTILPMGIGVGLGGISTYGHDIGGYNTLNTKPTTKEVFFRWTELGAWSPVMRTHHGTAPKVSWTFDKDAETLAHWKRYTELHTALSPYFIGLAKQAHDTGIPIWRSLALDFGADEKTWPIADEVMVGDGIVVAPVQAEGAVSRSVYLPKGRYYPWTGGASVEGGTDIVAPAALGEIPVFARAGAVVPTLPVGVETLVKEPSNVPGAAAVGESRVVYFFSGANGTFVEASGLAYDLVSQASPSGAVTASWQGMPLPLCASAEDLLPCFTESTEEVRVRAAGPGKAVVSAGGSELAVVTLTGMASGAAETLVLRR